VATALALDSVPVIVREITDPLEAESILIESNRQREKTLSDRMREAENLTRIVAEEAKAQQGARTDLRATLHEGLSPIRTDTAVAEVVGMKQRTYAKTKKVYDAATKGTAPEPVVAVARQQMVALDAGETTPHAAEKAVRGGGTVKCSRTHAPSGGQTLRRSALVRSFSRARFGAAPGMLPIGNTGARRRRWIVSVGETSSTICTGRAA